MFTNRFNISSLVLCFCCMLCMLSASANSQTSVSQSSMSDTQGDIDRITQFTNLSDVLMTGKAISSRSYWNADKSLILTDYTIKTTNIMKGDVPTTFTITVEGGQVGDTHLEVSDGVTLENQQEYILVLYKEAGKMIVYAGGLGTYKIMPNSVESQKVVNELKSTFRTGKEK